eukprot:GHVU01167791.1.p1 GENE.GHVU01167791.1~~GHVU01167791.1.p1  ORF type:complete len:222 (+),score=11.82 GHVU01167791.1:746-1411(+)
MSEFRDSYYTAGSAFTAVISPATGSGRGSLSTNSERGRKAKRSGRGRRPPKQTISESGSIQKDGPDTPESPIGKVKPFVPINYEGTVTPEDILKRVQQGRPWYADDADFGSPEGGTRSQSRYTDDGRGIMPSEIINPLSKDSSPQSNQWGNPRRRKSISGEESRRQTDRSQNWKDAQILEAREEGLRWGDELDGAAEGAIRPIESPRPVWYSREYPANTRT